MLMIIFLCPLGLAKKLSVGSGYWTGESFPPHPTGKNAGLFENRGKLERACLAGTSIMAAPLANRRKYRICT